ncbi:MAG TPA: signal peptidase II [Acetobacteraceae bacterium]|nr:signal peptidase II [Acetobacteraceae bacterium]
MNRRIAGFALAIIVLLADQASKYWILYGLDLPRRGLVRILPVLNFAMVWNHGVTFGLLAGDHAAPLLIAVAAIIAIVLLVWLWRARTLPTALAVGAITGGAIGNIISRLRYGAVVDFIDAHIGAWHWYVFNVADAAIVCGVATLIAESLFSREAMPRGAPLPAVKPGDKEAP